MLDEVGASPLSLLIIPHYHHESVALRAPAFVRAVDARRVCGDELVLHGCFHIDDAAPPRGAREWFERRILTRSEGEFAALDVRTAARRIAHGIALFEALGWPLAGFVPPAWLLSPGTRIALARCRHRFEYVTVRSGIYHLPDWRFEHTANFCYSPDTALRRVISACAIARERRHAQRIPLLRISLHPQDARVPSVMRHWRRLVVDALADREPVTKREWARRVRSEEARPAAKLPIERAREDAGASPARAIS